MGDAIYKVPGGKMLRAAVRIEEKRIKEAKITGDFFLHPEERILEIEKSFIGHPIPLDESACLDLIGSKLHEAQLIGASPKDILTVVRMACGE